MLSDEGLLLLQEGVHVEKNVLGAHGQLFRRNKGARGGIDSEGFLLLGLKLRVVGRTKA